MIKLNKKEKKLNIIKKIALIFASAIVGFINGFLGGGGGSLVVPCLQSFSGLEEKPAHATAIAIILPLSIVSGIIYFLRGDFILGQGLAITAGVVLGGILGAFILKAINAKLLSIMFYGIMIFAGVKMLL